MKRGPRKPPPPLEGKLRAVSSKDMLPVTQRIKLLGIPPVCLEIAQALLKSESGAGMRYEPAAPARGRLAEIETYMKNRIGRALVVYAPSGAAPGIRSAQVDGDLMFWLTAARHPGGRKGGTA